MPHVIETFSHLLDGARYDEAQALMSADCEYHYSEGNYAGAKAISNIWRQNHQQSVELFDEVAYDSEIEELDETTFKLTLVDKFRLGDKWHESLSYDLVTIEDGLITDIEHHEIAGEAERFRAFYVMHRERRATV